MENYKTIDTFRRMGKEVKKESKLIASSSGREYELLEGYTFFGNSSSDIIFIMEIDDNGYKNLVNYVFGANDPNTIDFCVELIEDYERNN